MPMQLSLEKIEIILMVIKPRLYSCILRCQNLFIKGRGKLSKLIFVEERLQAFLT